MKIPIGIVDDHQLFLKSVSMLVSGFTDFDVVIEALNGKDLQEKLKSTHKPAPAIMLIDVIMPIMNGAATAEWLKNKYPMMKLVALSMEDSDKMVISMIKAGCCAYLLKDAHPNELEKALLEIYDKGHYNSDVININYRRLLQNENEENKVVISNKEMEFLQYACSDLTYKQIAEKMFLSERTIDGYRESLFHKLKVSTRVGLALECVKRGFFKIEKYN